MLTFEGTFTSANEVSGTWELVLGGEGDFCTGTSDAIPNKARNELYYRLQPNASSIEPSLIEFPYDPPYTGN